MNTRIAIAAAALAIALVSGLQFAPAIAESLTTAEGNQAAAMTAAQKTRCIMPPALRTSCNF